MRTKQGRCWLIFPFLVMCTSTLTLPPTALLGTNIGTKHPVDIHARSTLVCTGCRMTDSSSSDSV